MTITGLLAAAYGAVTRGRIELGPWPHSPIMEAACPGRCICNLRVDHPDHGAAGRALAELLKSGRLTAGRRQR